MQIIHKYFQDLSKTQEQQFAQLYDLYVDWNQKINVISRKDIDQLYERHILHSLAIAKFLKFAPSSQVLDLGTGGGFPGVPLAIMFPEVNFTLIDGTRKKIKVVQSVIDMLNLQNAKAKHIRAEELNQQFDFIVVRAVALINKLYNYSLKLIAEKQINTIPNGIIALKGGDLKSELSEIKNTYVDSLPLSNYFEEAFFENKYLVYVQV